MPLFKDIAAMACARLAANGPIRPATPTLVPVITLPSQHLSHAPVLKSCFEQCCNSGKPLWLPIPGSSSTQRSSTAPSPHSCPFLSTSSFGWGPKAALRRLLLLFTTIEKGEGQGERAEVRKEMATWHSTVPLRHPLPLSSAASPPAPLHLPGLKAGSVPAAPHSPFPSPLIKTNTQGCENPGFV